MITAYRLVKSKYREVAFNGQGAKRYGGRWNSKGRSCVYLTSSISLGLLEVMAQVNNYAILQHYTFFELQIDPSALQQLSMDHLPDDWQTFPAPATTADIGDQWLSGNSSVALAVPSVIVPWEYNYLLNPEHAEFVNIISAAKEVDFQLDPRLV